MDYMDHAREKWSKQDAIAALLKESSNVSHLINLVVRHAIHVVNEQSPDEDGLGLWQDWVYDWLSNDNRTIQGVMEQIEKIEKCHTVSMAQREAMICACMSAVCFLKYHGGWVCGAMPWLTIQYAIWAMAICEISADEAKQNHACGQSDVLKADLKHMDLMYEFLARERRTKSTDIANATEGVSNAAV